MKVQEGTNKAIIINSAVLYARLIIISLCGFFTTRFALQALGIVDYGLFAVLGGIISLIDVTNTVMVSTTTRFMTVALGKGDEKAINQQFNINLKIHFYTAIFSFLIAVTIGYWYILTHLSYAGSIKDAILVFTFSIVAADISMLGIPYRGLITAKENFITICIPEVVSAFLKLIISILLVYFFSNKLLIYAGAQSFFTIYPIIIYYYYCRRHYPKIIKSNIIQDRTKYKEVLTFSGWTLYGTITCLAKGQGAAIVINMFFSTVMNAALGIANMLTGLINSIAQNASQPMFPQITKSYVAGDSHRSMLLLCMTTKLSFLIILFVSSPFLIDADWIIGLWLVDVPPLTSKLTCLLIIDLLVSSFNAGVSTIIKANGNISLYEFSGNTLRLIAVIVAYFLLNNGYTVESLFYMYIMCSFVIIIINQFILHYVTHIDSRILVIKSYFPSLFVASLFIPYIVWEIPLMPIFRIALGLFYLSIVIWFVGFSKEERVYISKMTSQIFNRHKR